MASLPGFRFEITGASGSQGLLGPKSSWRTYVFPRGGYASQDSAGTLITFDSADVASRFAADNWVQVGLSTANIRKVSAVGGDSMSVAGAAVTVSENDRIFLIGDTQPSTAGGSATYTIPDTIVRQRDDDGASIFTNSMITSNSDGLIQGFAETNFYDCIIQDGNRSNQGSVIDLPVGVVEGVSVSTDALFGANVTVNGALGVTGWATFGSTVTMNAQLGVTSHATFGDTVTVHGNMGVTGTATVDGWATFGVTVTANAALGVTGWGTFGASVTIDGAVGITGTIGVVDVATFGSSVGITGDITAGGGFRSYLVGFSRDNLAASQTNLTMGLAGSAVQTRVPLSRAGSITGVAVFSTESRTGGTATVNVLVNNSGGVGVSTTIGSGNSTTNSFTQGKDITTFSAEDDLSCRVSTTADWAPTTADLNAVIEIET